MKTKLNSTMWLPNLKSPETIRAFRAHLIVASAAAISIQLVALTAIFVAGVPVHFFGTGIFRLTAAVLILSIVAVARYVARSAFMAAIDRNEVTFLGAQRRLVSVSATCPRRQLVILHARFAGFVGDVFSE
ncbi:hypothetical protein P0D73_44550 [Paraburkholderia sp. RL18-101-BIB-B]|uniref:hypothetical protein n=1 Tax=Paraburkholderia sp. RL18-101-BIB-B TaxID=3031634 RepID=UPI0038BA3F75